VKKIFSILLALVLVVSLGLATAAPVLAGDIINVRGDYETIQEAIDNAEDGDTIMVEAGEYEAFQVMDKNNISVISTEGATVTTADLVLIEQESAVNVSVMALVEDSSNIYIEGINFDGTEIEAADIVGIIYLDSTGEIADLTVENTIGGTETSVGVAILSDEDLSDVEMTGSTISNNEIGILLSDLLADSSLKAHFNNIVDNTSYGVVNLWGVGTVNATHNWWGDASGPYHESLNPDGMGDEVSDDVDFDPWLEAEVVAAKTETVENETVDAKDEADTEVEVTGTATVTVAKYEANPGGPPASGFITMGKYIDVYVPDTSGVTEIEIRLYYTDAEVEAAGIDEESLRLFGWNGTDWVECSDSEVNTASTYGYSGYIWAIITADTTPSLDDLEGYAIGDGGVEGPSDGPQGGCFIATAAYGTDTARQLDILREFRDDVLLPNRLGAKLVSLYYKTSPPIADFISQNEVLRTVVRMGFVDPIVKILTWTHGLWSAGGS
jgi:hypothetical protein